MTQFDAERSFEDNENSYDLTIIAFYVSEWSLKDYDFKKSVSLYLNINSHEYN